MKTLPCRARARALALCVLVLAACAGPERAREAPPVADEAPVRKDLNERFLAQDLDVEAFVDTFESESREIAARREALTEALAPRPGERVADVGAGTGLFLEPFSRAVGPEGRVLAVEISPRFAEHLRQRARAEGLANVEVVLSDERESGLAANSVDAVFVCDTYHHFTYPQTTLANLHRALRPGGRLVVVDFERIEGVSSEWVLGHVRAGKELVRKEIEAAGFELVDEPDAGLTENYVLRFRRP